MAKKKTAKQPAATSGKKFGRKFFPTEALRKPYAHGAEVGRRHDAAKEAAELVRMDKAGKFPPGPTAPAGKVGRSFDAQREAAKLAE